MPFAVVLLAFATVSRYVAAEITSDTLFALAVARDALERPYAVRGWVLSPAPYLVPDLAGTAGLLFFLRSAPLAYFAYPFASFVAIWAMVGTLTRRLGGTLGWDSMSCRAWTGTAMVLWLGASWLEVGWFTAEMTLVAGFHGGAILMGLALLCLVVRPAPSPPAVPSGWWRGRRWFGVVAPVVLGLMTATAAFSDPIVVPQFVVPVAVGVWLVRERSRVWLLPLGIGSVAGVAALMGIERFGFSTGAGALPGQGESFIGGAFVFVRDLPTLVVMHPVQCVALVVVVGMGARPAWWAVAGHCRRSGSDIGRGLGPSSEADAICVALVLSAVLSLGATVLAKYDDVDHVRRFLPSLVLPLLFGAPILVWSVRSIAARRVARRRGARERSAAGGGELGRSAVSVSARVDRLVPQLALLGSMALAGWGLATDGVVLDFPYQRHQACLDDQVRSGSLHRGLADNWNARWFMELSRGGVELVPVDRDLTFRSWIVNPDLVLHPSARAAVYDFVLPARLDEAAIRVAAGPPSEVIDCAGLEVWRYEPDRLRPVIDAYAAEAALSPGARR